MNIEALSAVTSDEVSKLTPLVQAQPAQKSDFAEYVNQMYTDINEKTNSAEVKLKEYAVGEISNIHDVLISIEKAKLSFELGLQVRNRLLEGYQEIMRMQV